MKKLREIFNNKSNNRAKNQFSPIAQSSLTSGTTTTTTTTTTTSSSSPDIVLHSESLFQNSPVHSISKLNRRKSEKSSQERDPVTTFIHKAVKSSVPRLSSHSQRRKTRNRSSSNQRERSRSRSTSKARSKRQRGKSLVRSESLSPEKNNERPKLEQQPYFHGVLPRNEVTTLLCDEGDFLLREAGTSLLDTHIMLSVMHNRQTRHLDLQPADNGLFHIEGYGSFKTVPELIECYMSRQVPVTAKCPAVLRRAIERQEWEMHHDDVDVGKKLGGGNFGEVFHGFLKVDNKPVAIKMYRLVTGSSSRASSKAIKQAKTEFVNEAKLMRTFRHSNIVRLIGICASKDPMMIVMEYCPNGALNKHLDDFKPNIKRKMAYIVDVVKGMSFLEKHNCIHRDLAARNCLLSEKWIVKISDFGLSRQSTSPYIARQQSFPIKWSAPEAIVHQTFTLKSDVWSFGILLWEVFSDGAIVHPALSNKEVATAQMTPPGLIPDLPEQMPSNLLELYLSCLLYKKEDRPTFSELETMLLGLREGLRNEVIHGRSSESGSRMNTIPTDFKTLAVTALSSKTLDVSPLLTSPSPDKSKEVYELS